MDSYKIDEFEGMYTNVDESKQNPKFLRRLIDGRIRNGYLESEGYSPIYVPTPENVLYFQEVTLDEDRYANRVEDNELIPDYTQNLTTVPVIVTTGNQLYYKINNEWKLGGNLEGNFIKLLNHRGTVLLFTDEVTYWFGKISRSIKTPGIIEFFPVGDEYHLKKYYDFTDHYPSTVEIITIPQDKWIKVRLVHLETINPNFPPPLDDRIRFLKFNAYKEDGSIAETVVVRGRQNVGELVVTPGDDEYFRVNYRGTVPFVPGYQISLANFLAMPIEHLETTSPEIEGSFVEIVSTAVYGDNELVTSYQKLTNITTKFSLSFEVGLPIIEPDSEPANYRINALKYYIRTRDNDDFELIKVLDLTLGIPVDFNFIVTEVDRQGVYLLQNIGTLYKVNTYKPITVFSDFIRIGNTGFGINGRKVYYPVVAGGAVTDLFYDSIPDTEGDFLIDIGGDLGVSYSDRDNLKLISIQDSGEGFFLFAEKGKMSFSTLHKYSFIQTPEGTVIVTAQGLYALNGYERQIISEPINDIVERFYPDIKIFYDFKDQILFMIAGGKTYKYEFVYNFWSELELFADEFSLVKDPYLIRDGKLYSLVKTSDTITYVETPKIDLDSPRTAKNLIFVVFDMEGTVYYKGMQAVVSERTAVRLGFGVSTRIPSAGLGIDFAFKGKLYKIEPYYSVVGEISENTFQISKAVSEGTVTTS